MDFNVVIEHPTETSPGKSRHIMSTHAAGPDDGTPMQMISAARLAELERVEVAAKALAGALFVGRSQNTASIDADHSQAHLPTNSTVTCDKSSG